jgi:hypothetical protein
MGYTTNFRGALTLTPLPTKEQFFYIKSFSYTRKVRRDVKKLKDEFGGLFGLDGEYGIDGEYYVGDEDVAVIDINTPPITQPGLYCQWTLNEEDPDHIVLEWDGGEKFYNYIEWLKYLIENFFKRWGIKLNGAIEWRGEMWDDHGKIKVKDNIIKIKKH